MAQHQEMMFQNQLQFNLNVPLTKFNMAARFHHPGPITIERANAAPAGQGFPMAQLANRQSAVGHAGSGVASGNGFQFSSLSQDKMAAAVQLAQRDLKNQKLQQKFANNRDRSPSPDRSRQGKAVCGAKYWERQRSRMPKKSQSSASSKSSKMSMRVREHDRNRAPRSAGSQTPPSSPPRQAFLNTRVVDSSSRSDSPPTRDTPSLTRIAREPANDIEKLQLEMELCLQQIESVQKRALSEQNTEFLRRGRPRPHRDSYLDEEEDEERRQLRTNEQSHRVVRTIYNLQQQVREIERQISRMPHDAKATKKSQASMRLATVNKGAVKLLQNFINQLPQQDLRSGLPSHFNELTELVRQVTLLSAKASLDDGKVKNTKKSLSPVGEDVIAMVDQVEKLNQDWKRELGGPGNASTSGRRKPPFVTKFIDADSNKVKIAFLKEQVQNPQAFSSRGQDAWYAERKAMLQAGIRTLLNASRPKKRAPKKTKNVQPYSTQLAQPPPPKGYLHKIPTRKPALTRKGFLLPQKVREQKSRPGSQAWAHFADPTITSNLKASTLLRNPFTGTRSCSEPPSPREKKKVNFVTGSGHHHASYPGATAKRRSRSSSPRSPSKSPSILRGRSPGSYFSDSDSSPIPYFHSEDETSPSVVSGFDSPGPVNRRRQRSLSPAGGRGSRSRQLQRKASPGASKRRQFFMADADPELVDELFPEDRVPSVQSGGDSRKTASFHSQKEEANMMQEVERRVQQRLAQLMKNSRSDHNGYSDEEEYDRVANAIMDEAVNEVTEEFTSIERDAAAREKAAAIIDNPTCENMMQALERIEIENEKLRQKYSKITYHDSAPKRRFQTASQVFSEFRSERPREPPAFQVTNTRPAPADKMAIPRVFSEELPQEALIFTKDSQAYRSHVRFQEHGEAGSVMPLHAAVQQTPSVVRPKKLLSMKQTVVERITDSVERFEYYQRGLKQHLGKRNPFQVYESVADNILKMCCAEVAQELEGINTDMAENIYTSEFLDENGLPLAPPALAEDFETVGTAAQNLRDSAAAQRSVEAAVSKTVTALMLPAEEHEFPIVTPKRVLQAEGDTSPPWDTSLKHVFDATDLFEASVTEKPASKSGRGGVKDDDTQLEGEEDYEYDDDYTDISDEEEDETESPSPQ